MIPAPNVRRNERAPTASYAVCLDRTFLERPGGGNSPGRRASTPGRRERNSGVPMLAPSAAVAKKGVRLGSARRLVRVPAAVAIAHQVT